MSGALTYVRATDTRPKGQKTEDRVYGEVEEFTNVYVIEKNLFLAQRREEKLKHRSKKAGGFSYGAATAREK